MVWCLLAIHLLFALAPHHHQARHSHAEDGHGHTHALSTLHQAKLERQFLAALAPANHSSAELTEKLASTESTTPADQDILADAELMGAQGLKPQSQASHDHFFSDPNVDSSPTELTSSWVFCGRLAELPQALTRKAETTVAQASARGPPRA